ncbi:putative integral membrane protein [Agrobacterium vitis]|nr:putative integral membrane protein [Agrobacterium vitis]MBE1437353.1 putative integral membrane protein [Agrobacterium vitis]
MFKRLVNIVILVPLAIILIVLCVANRQWVTLALNPFRPDDQLLSASAPFFVFVLLAFLLGAVVGSAATWVGQGKHRKKARREALAAVKWRGEADLHKKRAEQMAGATTGVPQIPSR